jgi:RNA-directed DNA polymerase
VISPLLCNLFLNYAFDRLMATHHPTIPFERFADHILCHRGSEQQAKTLNESLEQRFAECGLELHPTKTKIVSSSASSTRATSALSGRDARAIGEIRAVATSFRQRAK